MSSSASTAANISVSATRPTAAPGTCSKPDSSDVSGAAPSGAEPPADTYAPPPRTTAAIVTAMTLRRIRGLFRGGAATGAAGSTVDPATVSVIGSVITVLLVVGNLGDARRSPIEPIIDGRRLRVMKDPSPLRGDLTHGCVLQVHVD